MPTLNKFEKTVTEKSCAQNFPLKSSMAAVAMATVTLARLFCMKIYDVKRVHNLTKCEVDRKSMVENHPSHFSLNFFNWICALHLMVRFEFELLGSSKTLNTHFGVRLPLEYKFNLSS